MGREWIDYTLRPSTIGGIKRWARSCALAAAAATAVAVVTAQTPTFRAETDLVTFGVSVQDRRGELVTNLAAEDFEVIEEGQKQSVRAFARGDVDSAPRTHVGLLYDSSASMGDD